MWEVDVRSGDFEVCLDFCSMMEPGQGYLDWCWA